MDDWDGRHAYLREEAERDLLDGVGIRPCLVAFAGPHPLLLAFLRCFEKGTHMDALIELLALAVPLGATRLALSISGRAWSLDDPVPPVVPDAGDLRQRILCVEEADGSAGRVRGRSSIYPYDVEASTVRWGDPVVTEEVTGPVRTVLELAIRRRDGLPASVDALRAQAQRCLDLGHLLAMAPDVVERLCPEGHARTRRRARRG